jgi:hypothetical protein
LQDIAAALEQNGLRVKLEKIDTGIETGKLYLLLWADEQQRDVVVEIMFLNELSDSMAGSDPQYDADDEDSITLLHFSILLPFRIERTAVAEAMRIAFMVNRLLPLGAIGCSEADGAFYLSYQLALPEPALPALVLQEVINLLSFAVETYATLLELAGRGELTAEELTEQLRQNGSELPLVGNPEIFRPRRH